MNPNVLSAKYIMRSRSGVGFLRGSTEVLESIDLLRRVYLVRSDYLVRSLGLRLISSRREPNGDLASSARYSRLVVGRALLSVLETSVGRQAPRMDCGPRRVLMLLSSNRSYSHER